MSMAIRTGADTVVRAVPTRRQHLRGAIDNGLLRPGADDTYADGDDVTWMRVDWPSMTRKILVEGREVNVVDTGGDEKPVLVFVHGLGGAWQNWLLNIPAFMDSHRVIAPDLPGFGESEMPREEVSIKGYARVLDGLLNELGVDSAPVVGNSMGGFVAAELALSFSTRVERLVLVSAAGRARQRGHRPAAGAPDRYAAARALPGEALAAAGARARARHGDAGLHPGHEGPALLRLPRTPRADRGAHARRLGPQRHARPARRRARVRGPDRRQRPPRDVRRHGPPVDARATQPLQPPARGVRHGFAGARGRRGGSQRLGGESCA